ncbi:family 2A encapsulin nanocompartment cargo protein cysteine desulfurase [Niabella aquatica]
MSTNTNPSGGLPHIEVLQDLANQYFKALPDEVPQEISLDPYEHPHATAFAKSITGTGTTPALSTPTEETYTRTPHQSLTAGPLPVGGLSHPPAVPGLGASSTAGNSTGLAGIYPGVNPLPGNGHSLLAPYVPGAPSFITGNSTSVSSGKDGGSGYLYPGSTPPFEQIPGEIQISGNNGVPVSVAGSGASPGYTHQQENFSITEPVTSFPDSNIDKKAAGADSGPFALPFVEEQPFWSDIELILKLVNISDAGIASPQIAPTVAAVTTPSYYFLSNEKHKGITLQAGNLTNSFDAYKIKKDFPILNEHVNGKPIVWLDNAATTQKPQSVIDRINYFYQHENSNIHRAAHELAARATDAYESAREKVRVFLGARSANEIIFVRGATEAINLIAQSWGDQYLNPGDEIIVSNLEHHANIVPWKRLADKKGLILKVIPVDDDGQILLNSYAKLLTPKVKLVAFTQVSNALGTVTPAEQMVAMAHSAGARVLIDGAQSVSHIPVNVQELDADWFVFSGHKVFGPTGIGVVYGKEELLNATEPWQGGGNMIQDVTFEQIKYHHTPNRFEAGTGNIADAVGLGAAIDYVMALGMANIGVYEHALLEYATQHLKSIPGVRLIGTAANKASVLSFTLKGYLNDEVGKILNDEGIAVRTGHHCAQPILRRMGVEATIRPSLAFYNTCEDVDRFISVLKKLAAK